MVNEWPGFITPIALFSRQIEEMKEEQKNFLRFTRIMRNIRCAMKQSEMRNRNSFPILLNFFTLLMNSMTTIRTHDRTSVSCCMFLNFISNIAIFCSRTNFFFSNENKSFFLQFATLFFFSSIYSFPSLFPNIRKRHERDREIFHRHYQ